MLILLAKNGSLDAKNFLANSIKHVSQNGYDASLGTCRLIFFVLNMLNKLKSGSAKSSNSQRKKDANLKGIIENFSNTVLSTQKSNLPEKDLKEVLKNIAKTYVDISSLCPFLFGSHYKKIDKKTRNELIEGGIIASMVAQHLLKLLPYKKSVSSLVKSAKNIRGKKWSVKTTYRVDKESAVQTYDVIFSVKESEKGKFLISNVDIEGIDGRKLLRDEIADMINKNGIQKTIEKLRKEM